MFTRILNYLLGTVDCCPWVGHAYGLQPGKSVKKARPPYLYSPAERRRRDASPWTLVQGILAPIQFAVFVGQARAGRSLSAIRPWARSGDNFRAGENRVSHYDHGDRCDLGT